MKYFEIWHGIIVWKWYKVLKAGGPGTVRTAEVRRGAQAPGPGTGAVAKSGEDPRAGSEPREQNYTSVTLTKPKKT